MPFRNATCTVAGDANTQLGQLQGDNCAYYVSYSVEFFETMTHRDQADRIQPQWNANSEGCGVVDPRTASYGAGFNSDGGGVYAMQWTSEYIKIWFFPRPDVPDDITNLTPNPANWGLPAADMQGSCTIDDHFQQHQIIFDNTFCGSWAGLDSVWNSSTASCAIDTGYAACNEFVAANPQAYRNSYVSVSDTIRSGGLLMSTIDIGQSTRFASTSFSKKVLVSRAHSAHHTLRVSCPIPRRPLPCQRQLQCKLPPRRSVHSTILPSSMPAHIMAYPTRSTRLNVELIQAVKTSGHLIQVSWYRVLRTACTDASCGIRSA